MDKTTLLEQYYGITPEMAGDGAPVPPRYRAEEIRATCRRLGDGPDLPVLVEALSELTGLLESHPRMNRSYIARRVYEEGKRRDLLRLYMFLHATRPGDNITLRSSTDSVQLANYHNWMSEELLCPFLRSVLPDITSAEDAARALAAARSRRGRKSADPRLPILLWGTYAMITDLFPFKTPMPDRLCECLLHLLQLWEIVPVNSIVDVMWVRAQLRYIKGKPGKPRFPLPAPFSPAG